MTFTTFSNDVQRFVFNSLLDGFWPDLLNSQMDDFYTELSTGT